MTWQRPGINSLIVFVLIGLALWVYGQTAGFGYVNYDDPFIVVENDAVRGASWDNLVELTSSPRDNAYLPLYYMSYWIDHAIFGADALGHHVVNVFFHCLNALLIFALWRRLGVKAVAGFLAAALFVVHPSVTESVAWISSRKDLVSMLFLMAGLHALLPGAEWKPHRFWMACLFFLLACFAKATALVFLPLAALLFWHQRSAGPPCALRKLAVLGGLAAALTAVHLGVAFSQETAAVDGGGTLARATSMLGVLTRYALLTLTPSGLTVHHDFPLMGAIGWLEVVGFLGLLFLTFVAYRRRRALSIPLLGALWWLAALLPFNNVAPRFSISMAERYLYIGMAGGTLFIATAALSLAKGRVVMGGAISLGLVLVAGFLAQDRVQVWANSETLWRDAIQKSPDATLPRLQLGHALEERALNEHPESAAATLDEVIELYRHGGRLSDSTNEKLQAHIKLATVLIRTQRLGDGLSCLDGIDRDLAESGARLPRADRDSLIITRASALFALGRNDEARLTLNRIGPLSPSRTNSRNMLATLNILEATALLRQSSTAEAQQTAVNKFEKGLQVYESILRKFPDHVKTRFDRARALHVATWRPDALINVTNEVVALTREFPNDARSWSLRARVIVDVDKPRAISHLTRAIQIDPYKEGYYLRLSLILKDLGKNKLAAQTLLGGLQVLPSNTTISRQLAEFYLSFAHHYRNTKELALALEAVERSLSMAGESRDAFVLRGELEENFAVDDKVSTQDRTRFWERARRSFEAALKMKATDTRARGGLARYYKYRGYAQLWEATRKIEDESPEAQTQRERRLRRAGMEDFSKGLGFAGAGTEFTVIRKQLQRYVDQLLIDGRTSLDGLQFEVARTCVADGIALLPDDEKVWILKARIEEKDGFPKASRLAWGKALSLSPDSLQVLYELGKAEYTASIYVEASKHLSRFVELIEGDKARSVALKIELNVARRIIARCKESIR